MAASTVLPSALPCQSHKQYGSEGSSAGFSGTDNTDESTDDLKGYQRHARDGRLERLTLSVGVSEGPIPRQVFFSGTQFHARGVSPNGGSDGALHTQGMMLNALDVITA